ncbi:MAG: hypothetical protein HY764_01035 [Candidatus Portnoybacteria bacterium]|nr:hypothetical protein [Candidatus Portnoybacteria bacterium]
MNPETALFNKESRFGAIYAEPTAWDAAAERLMLSAPPTIKNIFFDRGDIKKLRKKVAEEKPNLPDWAISMFSDALYDILADERRPIEEEFTNSIESLMTKEAVLPTDDPLQFRLRLSDTFARTLQGFMGDIVPAEKIFFKNFIEENNRPDGLLSLRVVIRK